MIAMPPFLPFALPDIGEDEINEVVDSLRSGWLTTGPKVRRFEEAFASYLGVKHAIAVNSATAGLHLAMEAIGIGPGDKVLTTPYTFTATSEVVRYMDADPVYVDIDPVTFNIDAELVRKALQGEPRIKAILPVHMGGQAADMDSIRRAAREHGCRVVEDAAHALPTHYKGRLIGGLSDATVFSFYATKTLATGEGGMLATNDDEIAARVRVMRLHGISRDVFDRFTASDRPSWYYEVIAAGFKYNMTDVAASLGIHQLRRLDEMRDRREEIAERYNEGLQGLPVHLPVCARKEDTHSWHLYIIQLDKACLTINRNRFIELMLEKGIGTSVHYIPLHMQPYWRDRYGLRDDSFPNATALYSKCVSLPIYSSMSDYDVSRVIAAVRDILEASSNVD